MCIVPLGTWERLCQPVHRASCSWNPLASQLEFYLQQVWMLSHWNSEAAPNEAQFYVAFSAVVLVGADFPFQALKVNKSPFVRATSLLSIWKYTELILLRETHRWSLGLRPPWTWCPSVSLCEIIQEQTQHNFCLLTYNHSIGTVWISEKTTLETSDYFYVSIFLNKTKRSRKKSSYGFLLKLMSRVVGNPAIRELTWQMWNQKQKWSCFLDFVCPEKGLRKSCLIPGL